MNIHRTLAIAAALFLTAASAQAQQAQRPAPPAQPDSATAGQRDEARRKIEAIRIARLTEALKLDEQTAAKFIPLITTFDQQRRALNAQNHEALMELRSGLSVTPPDTGRLKAGLEKIAKIQRDMLQLREKEQAAAHDQLSTEQQARYVLFQQDFMREMREIISGIRNAAMGGLHGGPGAGRGPGPGGRGRMPAAPPQPDVQQ